MKTAVNVLILVLICIMVCEFCYWKNCQEEETRSFILPLHTMEEKDSVYSFTLDMDPPTTTAQQRRWTRSGYSFLPPKVRAASNLYKENMAEHKPAEPYDGTLRVDILFVYPTKNKNRWGLYKTTKPDQDNACKLLLDAMGSARGVGIISDDARIADLHVVKRWGMVGSVSIAIERMKGGDRP